MKRFSSAIAVLLCLALSVHAEELTADTVSIFADPETGTAPLQVTFSVNTAKEISSYAWDFNADDKIDSRDKMAAYLFPKEGVYIVTLTVMSPSNETVTVTKKIVASTVMTASISANPSSGTAPLIVQFTAAATGKEPLSYSWDFTSDGKIDSTQQNPTFTYDADGEYTVTLTVMDATGNKVTKTVPVTASRFDSKLSLTSYFPTTLKEGENQITFIVSNGGKEVLSGINAKVVGGGIQHLTSTEIARLNPGEQDSLTVKVNILQSGAIEGTAKVLDKFFPVQFTVTGEIKYDKEQLQKRLDVLKAELQEQETIYYDKKSQEYLVAEIFESIKGAKKQLQDIQENILTEKLSSAKVNLDLVGTSIEDIETNLAVSKKQDQTFLQWLKENAVAITAIIAALGTVSGLLIKASHHAKKLGENVKMKMTKKPLEEKKEHPLEEKKEEPRQKEEKNPEGTEGNER
ncbi:PKD domain-containing protein [Candidatus Woesearchaeota archaeon]|nr:PKD domain-containing protein [Candidatus Woesearchaeota archaeon]